MTKHRHFMFPMSGCITIILLLLCSALGAAQDTPTPQQQKEIETLNAVIQPDPDIQSRLRDLVPSVAPDAAANEQEWRNRIRELRGLGGDAYRHLVPQLVYFSVYNQIMESQGDVMEAMLPLTVIRELEIGQSHINAAMAPYLDTGHKLVDHEVREFMGAIENYEFALAWKFEEGEDLPRSLVQYLYKKDPGTTLLTIQKAHGLKNPKEWKPVLWAEHQVSDVLWKWRYHFLDPNEVEPAAVEALMKLATHEEWWARLYVAEVMRQYKPFRSPELIAILKDDQDETVRSVVAGLMLP